MPCVLGAEEISEADGVPAAHLASNHYPRLTSSCSICRAAMMTEAPARRRGEADERIKFEKNGDAVDLDTLHLTTKDDVLDEATSAEAIRGKS